jgi:hypothetical protein
VMVAVVLRRPASLRSRNTAAIAAAKAAPSAIKVICQPAMPPVPITWTIGAGTTEVIPSSSPTGIGCAKAAGTTATDASRPEMAAARKAARRRRRAPALRTTVPGRRESCLVMILVLSARIWPALAALSP